jgi:hypothetical protein
LAAVLLRFLDLSARRLEAGIQVVDTPAVAYGIGCFHRFCPRTTSIETILAIRLRADV